MWNPKGINKSVTVWCRHLRNFVDKLIIYDFFSSDVLTPDLGAEDELTHKSGLS